MTQTAEKQKTKRPLVLRWLVGYAAVLVGAVGLVYYWRVVFELADLPAVGTTLGVAGIASVLYAGVFLAWRFCHTLPARAAACIFLSGLLFAFATAPLQVPDEGNHYLRAWSIAHGRFSYDYDSEFADDVNWLFSAIGSDIDGGLNLNHSVRYQQKELAPALIARYREGVASGAAAPRTASEPIIFQIITFLPAALAMFLARLFGFSALGLLYAGRIANLLVYTAICYRVFRNCDKYRGVFIAMAMLPLSLSLAASCSYDSLLLALSFLAVSYFCKAEIHTRDVIVFGVAVLLCTYIKTMSIFLVAVLLLVPKERWRSKINPWVAVGAAAGGVLLFWYLMGLLDGGALALNWPAGELDAARTDGAQPAAQLLYILQYPFVFASVAVQTVYEAAGYLFALGTFGWQDLELPLVGGLSVMSLCAASALGIQQKDDTKKGGAIGLLLAAVLYSAAVLGGMYVLETAYRAIRISGLQARYFLPAMLLVFMLFSILLGKAVRPRLGAGSDAALRTQNITLGIALALAVLCAVLLFQSYFIGQWIPKTDSGYKLVNIFGWQYT